MAFKEKFSKMKTEIEEFFKNKGVSVKVYEDKMANLIAFKKGNDELKPEKFEDVPLSDGVTTATIEPAIEVGAAIVLQTPDTDPVAAPVGDYELQDGRTIVVSEDGVVGEIKEPTSEEPIEEPMNEDNPEEPSKVKRLIESITKTKEFREFVKDAVNDEFSALKKENEDLKKEVEELKESSEKTDEFIKEKFTSICEMVGEEPEKNPAVKGKFSQVLGEDEDGNPIIKSIKTA